MAARAAGNHRETRLMAATKNHDYHILPPDVWPIIGATSALALFGGTVMWMHDNPYGKFVFLLGLLGRAGDHVQLVEQCHPRGSPGRPHAGGAASPALRHDPVHRVGSDVLRRLVLGLFLGLAIPCRRSRSSRVRRRPSAMRRPPRPGRPRASKCSIRSAFRC